MQAETLVEGNVVASLTDPPYALRPQQTTFWGSDGMRICDELVKTRDKCTGGTLYIDLSKVTDCDEKFAEDAIVGFVRDTATHSPASVRLIFVFSHDRQMEDVWIHLLECLKDAGLCIVEKTPDGLRLIGKKPFSAPVVFYRVLQGEPVSLDGLVEMGYGRSEALQSLRLVENLGFSKASYVSTWKER